MTLVSAAEALGESYEIQIYREKAGWVTAGTFAEREQALAGARSLAARAEVRGVKVIKELFLEKEQLFVQQTVYRSVIKPDRETRMRQAEQTFKRLGERHRRRQLVAAALRQERSRRRRVAFRRLRFFLGLVVKLTAILGSGLLLLAWILAQY